MARNFKFKIKGRATVSPRFTNPEFIARNFQNKAARLQKELQLLLIKTIDNKIKRSAVFKALVNPPLGVRGYDLPAEFGLYPQDAESAAYLMLYHLVLTCDATVKVPTNATRRTRSNVSTQMFIELNFLDPQEYESKLKGGLFTRTSQKRAVRARKARAATRTKPARRARKAKPATKYTMKWMKWLLNARDGISTVYKDIPNVREYGIAYFSEGLPEGARHLSRSGRALMVTKNSGLGGKSRPSFYRGISYKFPQVAEPKAGRKNFIDEIARDKLTLDHLRNRTRAISNRILLSRSGR